MFSESSQAVGLYCSCRAAQASKGNFQKTCYETFRTSGRPTQYTSQLKVKVITWDTLYTNVHSLPPQDREPLVQFLVRLCAAVGGLVACSKMVCLLLKSAVEMYCCKVDGSGRKEKRGFTLHLQTLLLGGATTCSEGFVNRFLGVPQAVGLYCSCHAAQASKGNF